MSGYLSLYHDNIFVTLIFCTAFTLRERRWLIYSDIELYLGAQLQHHYSKTRLTSGLFLCPRKASSGGVVWFSLLSAPPLFTRFLPQFSPRIFFFLSPFSAGLLTVKRAGLVFITVCGDGVGVGNW